MGRSVSTPMANTTQSMTRCDNLQTRCPARPVSNRACSITAGEITLLRPASRSTTVSASGVGSKQLPCRIIVIASLKPGFYTHPRLQEATTCAKTNGIAINPDILAKDLWLRHRILGSGPFSITRETWVAPDVLHPWDGCYNPLFQVCRIEMEALSRLEQCLSHVSPPPWLTRAWKTASSPITKRSFRPSNCRTPTIATSWPWRLWDRLT